jgi:hypothetical protein
MTRGGLPPAPPTRIRLVRARVAAFLLAAGAVFLSARLLEYSITQRRASPGMDEVSRHEARLAPVRASLPAHGIVGYLSDQRDRARALFLAQYVLAPVVLDPSAERDTVVGDFADPRAGRMLAARRSLEVVRDFGDGLVLLRRRPRSPSE